MTNLDSILKNKDITLPTKVRLVKAMVFPVVIYRCESWTMKKAEYQGMGKNRVKDASAQETQDEKETDEDEEDWEEEKEDKKSLKAKKEVGSEEYSGAKDQDSAVRSSASGLPWAFIF